MNILLLAIFGALQAADFWTTVHILAAGGRELNPLLARLFVAFGVLPVLIVFKVALVALATLYLADRPYVLVVLCVLYAWVVWHNRRQM